MRRSLLERVGARRDEIASVKRAAKIGFEEFSKLLERDAYGGTETGAGTVTVNSALRIAAYYSGVRYLSEQGAGLPSEIFRKAPDGTKELRARPPWRVKPHPSSRWDLTIESTIAGMVTRGNPVLVKERDPITSSVIGLTPVMPQHVKMGLDPETGEKWFSLRDARGREIPKRGSEVLHVPGFTLDGFFGLDAIRYHASALGIGRAADRWAESFYSGTSKTHGYISIPGKLDEPEIRRLKMQWDDFHRGTGKAHDFGVLGDGATYQTISLDPEQAQLLTARQFTVVEIARMLRIPPHKLYELAHATFSNIEHQSIESVVDSIRPWVIRIENAVTDDEDLLPPENFLEFNLDGLLRGDTAARYEAYNKGIQSGFIMPSEPRKRENFEHVDGLDYFLVPLNMKQIGPDAPDRAGGLDLLEAVTAIQKLYLGVGTILSEEEARALLTAGGIPLAPGAVPRPDPSPVPAPAPES